jgi:hypothetical protein
MAENSGSPTLVRDRARKWRGPSPHRAATRMNARIHAGIDQCVPDDERLCTTPPPSVPGPVRGVSRYLKPRLLRTRPGVSPPGFALNRHTVDAGAPARVPERQRQRHPPTRSPLAQPGRMTPRSRRHALRGPLVPAAASRHAARFRRTTAALAPRKRGTDREVEQTRAVRVSKAPTANTGLRLSCHSPLPPALPTEQGRATPVASAPPPPLDRPERRAIAREPGI